MDGASRLQVAFFSNAVQPVQPKGLYGQLDQLSHTSQNLFFVHRGDTQVLFDIKLS